MLLSVKFSTIYSKLPATNLSNWVVSVFDGTDKIDCQIDCQIDSDLQHVGSLSFHKLYGD